MELNEKDQYRFDSYMEFLKENGANPEIMGLEGVRELIAYFIKNGDIRVKAEGRSPVAYLDPNPDGTFPIGGRTAGPVVNERYDMEYCNDGSDNFIKLTNKTREWVSFTIDFPFDDPYEIEVVREMTIDRAGNITSDTKDWYPVHENKETIEADKGIGAK